MRVGLTLLPGQRGTKKLLTEYGERLLRVRYRYDGERQRRLKTVEIIVAEAPWRPRSRKPRPDQIVEVRTRWGEVEIGRALRRAGGNWNRGKGVWEIAYAKAIRLGLAERISDSPGERQSIPGSRRTP